MKRVVLASGSANRKTIFNSLHIPFEVIPSNINEKAIKEKDPAARARLLAQLKGEAVLKKQQAIVVAADTFTSCKNKILEKPQTTDEAKKMLLFLSEKTAINNTGFYYHDPFRKIIFSKTVTTQVWFRRFFEKEIDQYIKKFPVKNWAAAYAASELYVAGMIEKVEGSLTGLTYALPLEHLVPLLIRSGFNPHP
jgi:septum formation protein